MLLRGESCFDFSMSSPVVVEKNNLECRVEAMTAPSNTIVSSLIAEDDQNAIIQRQNNPNLVTPAVSVHKLLCDSIMK